MMQAQKRGAKGLYLGHEGMSDLVTRCKGFPQHVILLRRMWMPLKAIAQHGRVDAEIKPFLACCLEKADHNMLGP